MIPPLRSVVCSTCCRACTIKEYYVGEGSCRKLLCGTRIASLGGSRQAYLAVLLTVCKFTKEHVSLTC